MPNKEKYTNSLLNFMEQFCHPLPNELDHCAVCLLKLFKVQFRKVMDLNNSSILTQSQTEINPSHTCVNGAQNFAIDSISFH